MVPFTYSAVTLAASSRIDPEPSEGTWDAVSAVRWHDGDDLRWAIRDWAARLGVQVRMITIRRMRTKWASVSTAGRLTMNEELLGLPRDLGEYVIVHELVHLVVPNHGVVFKSLLSAYLPDWQQRARRLNEIGATGAR